MDWVYQPTVQSGGKYDLRIAVPSDDELLKEGAIICSLGVRYKAYCSQLSRTYFVNPTKEQERDYAFLVDLQQYALGVLKDGVKCSEVYLSVTEYIDKHRPDLRQYFMKNMGWSIGVEPREYLILSAKCHHIIKAGTIFALIMGLHNIKAPSTPENSKNDLYSLLLSDTVVVNRDAPATPLTKLNRAPEVVTYVFDEKVDRSRQVSPNDELNGGAGDATGRLRSNRRKREAIYVKESQKGRESNQKRLHKALQESGCERFKNSKNTSRDDEGEVLKKFESYKKEFQLPEKIKDNPIVLDKRNETVVFSINGHPVPFHMFTIKSVSLTDEQNYSYLRVNFVLSAKGKKEQPVVRLILHIQHVPIN